MPIISEQNTTPVQSFANVVNPANPIKVDARDDDVMSGKKKLEKKTKVKSKSKSVTQTCNDSISKDLVKKTLKEKRLRSQNEFFEVLRDTLEDGIQENVENTFRSYISSITEKLDSLNVQVNRYYGLLAEKVEANADRCAHHFEYISESLSIPQPKAFPDLLKKMTLEDGDKKPSETLNEVCEIDDLINLSNNNSQTTFNGQNHDLKKENAEKIENNGSKVSVL